MENMHTDIRVEGLMVPSSFEVPHRGSAVYLG